MFTETHAKTFSQYNKRVTKITCGPVHSPQVIRIPFPVRSTLP